MGCYQIVVLPWPGFGNSSAVFRLRLDSLGSVGARRLVDITRPGTWYRDTTWSAYMGDSIYARLIWGIDGQGYELHYMPQREVRTRPVIGTRQACPSHSS
jgi:hypothetical protein